MASPRFSNGKTCSTPGSAGQRGGAVGPRLDDRAGAGRREPAERSLVLGAEAHDLAAADGGAGAAEAESVEVVECRAAGRMPRGRAVARLREGGPERRRLVLEDRDVVERRDLGRVRRRLRRQGVEVRRRQEGAVLPRRGDRHPVAGEHVLAHGRGRGPGVERALIDGAHLAERRAGVVEVDQLAAVGEARRALDDTGAEDGCSRLEISGHAHVNTLPACLRQHAD